MSFDLVYILLWEHVNLPLVFSQTFDQAQKQSEIEGELAPNSVSVWVMTPLRFYFGKKERSMLRNLEHRCPGIKIQLLPEISRLNNFPLSFFLKYYRRKLLAKSIVFHFRGEGTLHHFIKQYTKQTTDKFVVDVRGFWPAELLYAKGIEDVSDIPNEMQKRYDEALSALKNSIELSDGVITVSKNLSVLLHDISPSLGKVNIVPCSVRSITDHSHRATIRQKLGVLEDEKLLVYSGGCARYQHLEDLTIPFIKLLISLNSKIKVLILSHVVDQIKPIVERIMGSTEKFIFLNVPQNEVAGYLVACDLGFLLRRESLVNRVAQPVKIGEYLAAGVPVCVQGAVGGVSEKLVQYQAGITVDIVEKGSSELIHAAKQVLGYLEHPHTENARSLARDYFLWEVGVVSQRKYYEYILEQ